MNAKKMSSMALLLGLLSTVDMACAQSGTPQQSTGPSPARTAASPAQGITTGKNLAESAALSKDHTILLSALKVAGLTDKAVSGGPYTVFAPTNAAFRKLPSGMLDNLLKPAGRPQPNRILGVHVVEGNLLTSALQDGQQLKTVSGETLTVQKQGDTVILTDLKGGMARVQQPDIQATNGVVHSVDTVLMPNE